MLRYMIFAWDATRDEQQRYTAEMINRLQAGTRHWQQTYQASGLVVLCIGERSGFSAWHPLPNKSGIILGTIFERAVGTNPEMPAKQAIVDEAASHRIVASEAHELIENYWGSYVAVVHDFKKDATCVLRSPVGNLPCLTTVSRGVRLYFSYLPDCIACGVSNLSIDWDYIAMHVLKYMPGASTGLKEISVLRGGYCDKLRAGQVTTVRYWDPSRLYRLDPIDDSRVATEVVRDATMACVGAWSSCHPSIIHSLSGGLDSSIVLKCLSRGRPSAATTCVTIYGDDMSNDERDLARLVARETGCELIEYHVKPNIDWTDGLKAEVSEIPERYLPSLVFGNFERQLAQEKGATAVFSGEKGDEIFLRSAHDCAADYVAEHGLDSRFVGALLDRAERESISIWKAAREALYKGLIARKLDVLRHRGRVHTLISDALLSTVAERLRQRTDNADALDFRVPPGKQYHIFNCVEPTSYYPPLREEGDPEPLAPLMSQPLIETCIRIPTYVLTQGGWDRAIARRAFATELPPAILHRRAKGTAGSTPVKMMENNLQFLRELILDGALLQRGFLDRNKVQEILSNRPSGAAKGYAPLLRYLAIEIWLSICRRRGVSIAA